MPTTKKIKVLFLIDRLLKGGTENQLIWLVESLPIDKFSPVIGVLTDTLFSDSLKLNTPIVKLGISGPPLIKNILTLKNIKKYIDIEKFDIVQTQFPISELYGAVAANASKAKPLLILTRRNLYHWRNGFKGRLIFLLSKESVKKAHVVLVNSFKVRELCNRIEKVPLTKIKVLQNGVDISRFEKILKGEAKSKFGYLGLFPLIGVIGNWRPIKGLMIFLKAATIIRKTLPNSKFVLVGFGPQEKELKSFVQNSGLQDAVSFLNNDTDIPHIMAALDIAVQPSLSESFSNVLIEYMAAGKPIVATATGDAEDVLSNGQFGIVVPVGDHATLASEIISLCNDYQYASNLGKLASEKVKENWAMGIILKKYISTYLGLLKRN